MTNGILWEIGCDLASATTETDIAGTINGKAKQLIDFSAAAIEWISPIVGNEGVRKPLDMESISLLQKSANLRQCLIEHCPKYIRRLGISANYVSAMIIALKKRSGDIFGALIFFRATSEPLEDKQIVIVRSIANQVSLAGESILQRTELKRKERELSLLLSFSYDLALETDMTGFQFVLKQYLKQLLRSCEYRVTIRNLQDNSYSCFLHDQSTDDPTPGGNEDVAPSHMHITRKMISAVLCSDDPVNFPGSDFSGIAGVNDILGIRLKTAGKDIGICWIRSGKADKRLIKGVFAQVAVAIAGLLTSGGMERQMEELRHLRKHLQERALKGNFGTNDNQYELVGKGREMRKIHLAIEQVAFCDSTVLILGETGTGKEIIARAIHACSPRRNKLMTKVNCAAIPANLLESELFGHERGSFTGAFDRKIGKFELASNSTLFLDEIAELPLNQQVKLLRAIQEQEIDRIGGKKPIKINVRIVAATNRDLKTEVAEGRFRSDLYHRLNVFPIFVPALRHRLEDIPLLAGHLIQKLSGKTGKEITGLSTDAMDFLMKHDWPGNIRELENCILRAILMSTSTLIEHVEIPGFGGKLSKIADHDAPCKTLYDNERDHIITVLRKCKGKVAGSGGAAEMLNVNSSTLNSRMRKLGIKRGRFISYTENE